MPDTDAAATAASLAWGRGGTGAPAVTALYRALVARLSRRGARGAEEPAWLMAPDEASFAEASARVAAPLAGVDVIIATSGSTDGRGHLVGLSLDALIASASATLDRLGGPGRWVTSLPIHGVAGFQVVLRSALAGHEPRVYAPASGFDEPLFAEAVAGLGEGRRYLSLVPTQLHAALEAGTSLLGGFDAILVGGAALSPDLAHRARDAGARIVTTYGSTETSGGCVYDGVPLEGTSVRLADGRVLLATRGLALGYLDAAEQPFLTDADGVRWLVTPDVGHLDAAGRLVVDGRADDVLISGGTNVSPLVIERALSRLGGEWLVVGVPDPHWGQLVTAVTTHPDADLAAARAATGALRPAERPRALVRVDALPLRPTGKPDRRAAAALARAELARGAADRH